MEGAKSSVGSCELPTGVLRDDQKISKSVVFREMAGPEEDVLAAQSMSASQKISQILVNCTTDFDGERESSVIRKLIDKLVITDRWYLLTQLRCHSLGPRYEFKAKCPSCEHVEKLTVDLRETKVADAPHASQLFRDLELPSGKKVRWKVADGQVEAMIEQMAKKNPDKAATVALASRVTEIDGQPSTFAQVLNLSMRDRQVLRQAIDKGEGDFEDSFDAQCGACGTEYKVELQLEAESFFYPSATS